ncbi:MAG: hypothetical protein RIB60_09550 [Phycisphaerales bacterium]
MTGPTADLTARNTRSGWTIAAGALAVSIVALAAWGDPALLPATLAGIGVTLGATAALVGGYALTACGLGVLCWPLVRGSRDAAPVALACGVGLALTLSHGLGALGGLLPGVTIGLAVLGAATTFVWVAKRNDGRPPPSRAARQLPRRDGGAWGGGSLAWLCAVPMGVLIVAASAPPGWLWASEFGAYDALAYHLQLPQEWWRRGRVWPAEHNVYAFLPSYVEAAFVHLAALGAAPIDGADGHGLTAGNAWRAQATHGLSAAFAVLAAWLVGRFVRAVLIDMDADERAQRVGAWVSGALVLATPWVVVVGSIAYNETAVLAMGAGAMLVAVDRRVRPVWRGAIAGGLVGVACGCKPTAMFFVTPVVGVLLIAHADRRAWAPVVGGAVVMGTITIAPWLVRNWVAAGNPVFPAMTGVFGAGHWTAEQAARFAGAHVFEGSWLDRVRLLVADNPGAGAGAPLVQRFRGFANPQWGLLLPMGVVGAALAWRGASRRIAMALGIGLLIQIIAWLGLTHLQSRFLLPSVLTLAPLAGLGVACWRGASRVRFLTQGVVIAQTCFLVGVFMVQQRGRPSGATGVGLSLDVARPESEMVGRIRPWAWVNANLPDDMTLYLVGDAAAFLYERDVLVNSTYDAWPVGDAIELDPGDPLAWTRTLRDSGVDAVLISFGEIDRLERSGWIDPRVTPDRVERWVGTLGRPTMVWPDSGRGLWIISGDPG